MSQFLIAISDTCPKTNIPNIEFIPIEEAQQVFYDAALENEINIKSAWAVIDETGDTTDQLFGDASIDLSQGDDLSKTVLGQLLGELIYSGIGLLAWYANDYDAIDKYSNIIELIEYINRELPIGSGEVYFVYGKNS